MSTETFYPLLAAGAQAYGHPALYGYLAQQAGRLVSWAGLPVAAERHGLAPLLYTHLQAAGIAPPPSIRKELQGLYLRHRHASRVRGRVLAEILSAFQAAGLPALLLKGAALAYLAYPEPSLRPMRDVDILVRASQARQAQAILAGLGFEAPLPPPGDPLPAKHLGLARRQVDGLPLSVEIHHNLFSGGKPAAGLDGLLPSARPFDLAGVTAYSLGYEAMLAHIHRHAVTLFEPLRLIWLADLVSLASRFAAEINWPQLRRRCPHLLSSLALFHWLTPLPEALAGRLALDPGPPCQEPGREFQGWPRYALAAQRAKGYRQLWRDSFYPPEWWLRLYYGLGHGRGPAWWWYRWAGHPLHILGWAGGYGLRLCRSKVGKWSHPAS